MPNYKKMYDQLFYSMTKAIEQLQQGQQECERLFMQMEAEREAPIGLVKKSVLLELLREEQKNELE